MIESRKFGKLSVSRKSINESPEMIVKGFSKIGFLPLRAECHFMTNRIEYEGCSKSFVSLEVGQMIPSYTLSIHTDKNGFKDATLSEPQW